MGRQVNFWMAPQDQSEFLGYVMKGGEIVLLPRVSPTGRFEPVGVPPKPSAEYPPGWPYFLMNQLASSNLVTKSNENGYLLDPLESSVVEYSPSTTHGSILYPGRIWAQFTYTNDQTKSEHPKETQFEAWYEMMAKWIRARYKPMKATAKMTGVTSVVGVAGPSALEFLRKGGMFSLNLIIFKKKIEGKTCALCGGIVEEETVLLGDQSVRRVSKCLDLNCTYCEMI